MTKIPDRPRVIFFFIFLDEQRPDPTTGKKIYTKVLYRPEHGQKLCICLETSVLKGENNFCVTEKERERESKH